jgi:hypothetical protein
MCYVQWNRTLLHTSARWGYTASIEIFLQAGLNKDEKDEVRVYQMFIYCIPDVHTIFKLSHSSIIYRTMRLLLLWLPRTVTLL